MLTPGAGDLIKWWVGVGMAGKPDHSSRKSGGAIAIISVLGIVGCGLLSKSQPKP